MKIKTAKIRIGDIQLEVEPNGANFKEQILQIVNLRPRQYCKVCKNTNPKKFKLFVNKNDEYIFPKIICYGDDGECKAKSDLGQHKDPKEGFFWKPFEKFEKSGTQTSSSQDVPLPVDEDMI